MWGFSGKIRNLAKRLDPRRGRRAPRKRTDCPLEVTSLEGRQLLVINKITVAAVPNLLVPPDGQFVPVTVKGLIGTTLPVVPKAFFKVTDQYRRDEPFAALTLTPTVQKNVFSYSVTFRLQAKRSTRFPMGRHYYVLVGAGDNDGGNGVTVPVLVPLNPPPAKPPKP